MLPHLQIFVLDEVAHFGFPKNRYCMLVSLNSKTMPSIGRNQECIGIDYQSRRSGSSTQSTPTQPNTSKTRLTGVKLQMWVPGRSSSFPLPPLPHTWYDLISEEPVCGGHDALAGGLVLTTSEASACLAYWTGSQSGSLWVEDVVFRIKTWYEPTSEHLESFIITISMLNES